MANFKRKMFSEMPTELINLGNYGKIIENNIVQIDRLQNELADAMKGFKPMNEGGFVGGIGQFSELERPNALPSFVDAPTPEEEIESAIRRGTTSDEEFFALAKAKQSQSPIARQFHMDRANRIRNQEALMEMLDKNSVMDGSMPEGSILERPFPINDMAPMTARNPNPNMDMGMVHNPNSLKLNREAGEV